MVRDSVRDMLHGTGMFTLLHVDEFYGKCRYILKNMEHLGIREGILTFSPFRTVETEVLTKKWYSPPLKADH